jgi:hypothetical protein
MDPGGAESAIPVEDQQGQVGGVERVGSHDAMLRAYGMAEVP